MCIEQKELKIDMDKINMYTCNYVFTCMHYHCRVACNDGRDFQGGNWLSRGGDKCAPPNETGIISLGDIFMNLTMRGCKQQFSAKEKNYLTVPQRFSTS